MVEAPASAIDQIPDGRIPTALVDQELESFGTPDPRILVCGCGGSGNNTMNRITHIGVEGAVTVAINTDKQHLDHTRAMQKLLVGPTNYLRDDVSAGLGASPSGYRISSST
jgi:cell division GTPase FtsZ